MDVALPILPGGTLKPWPTSFVRGNAMDRRCHLRDDDAAYPRCPRTTRDPGGGGSLSSLSLSLVALSSLSFRALFALSSLSLRALFAMSSLSLLSLLSLVSLSRLSLQLPDALAQLRDQAMGILPGGGGAGGGADGELGGEVRSS